MIDRSNPASNLASLITSAALLALALGSVGCAVGPNYHAPAAPVAPTFTGAAPAPAAEQRSIGYSDWWKTFQDPVLDGLETQADSANRDVRVSIARVEQAAAGTKYARSYLYPTVNAQPSVARAREAKNRPNNGNTGGRAATYNDFQLPLVLSYEPDAWGRVRRTVEAAHATQEADEADLRFVRLGVETQVAITYYQLRETDQEFAVVESILGDLRQSVDLTRQLFENGLNSDLQLAQANTLLEQTLASEQSLRIARGQFEHALAVLLGRTPEGFQVPRAPSALAPPTIPVGLPSDLLQRRPDIAEADRNFAAATAQIGVAKAAYFPQLSLTGTAGYESTAIGSLVNWQNSLASLATSAIAPLFTGGRLRAGVEQAQAYYRQTLSQYEQTVLVSYQQVEDQLTALHFLATEYDQQNQAIADANRAEKIATDQYKRGLASYLDVINAQQAVLFNERTAAQISGQRLVASVVLVKALGGGWTQTKTP